MSKVPANQTLKQLFGKDIACLIQKFLLDTDKAYQLFRAAAVSLVASGVSQGVSNIILGEDEFDEYDPRWINRLAGDLSNFGYICETDWAKPMYGMYGFIRVWYSRELWKQYAIDFDAWREQVVERVIEDQVSLLVSESED